MTQRAKSEPEKPPVDWSKISARPGPTSATARPDPAATSAVSPIDARILRERELEELGRLYDACVEWHDRTNPNLRNGHDRTLAQAIARARRFR